MLEQTQAGTAGITIYPMEYRAIVASGFASPEPVEETPSAPNAEQLQARVRELERELEERSRSFEAGLQAARAEAREAGRASERGEHAARMAAATDALTAALEKFGAERNRYLAQVEREVVKLALAIAARVLRRESLMDPLLLAGAVRVALGQLSDTTAVRIKVPSQEHEMWSEMLRLMPNLPLHPEVIADDALCAGECLLETQLGSVDLGVKSQLAEIERGFFDLLEQRAQGSGERSAISGKRSEGIADESAAR